MFPAAAATATMWLDFEGIQTTSTVYLNGVLLGSHDFGYTNSRYFLNASLIHWNGADNVLAVKADCTQPDSWWCVGRLRQCNHASPDHQTITTITTTATIHFELVCIFREEGFRFFPPVRCRHHGPGCLCSRSFRCCECDCSDVCVCGAGTTAEVRAVVDTRCLLVVTGCRPVRVCDFGSPFLHDASCATSTLTSDLSTLSPA